MDLCEEYIKYCVSYAMKESRGDLEFLSDNYDKTLIEQLTMITQMKFPRVSYTAAIDILVEASKNKKNLFKETVVWGIHFASEHERYLTDIVFKSPLFLYNFPSRLAMFYTKSNTDNETVLSMDLLVPGIGEVAGGSEREDRLDKLEENIKRIQCEDSGSSWNKEWYLDLRRFGSAGHSGFGVGFDRLVMLVTGMTNIKDVTPYPRYAGHAEF